MGPKVTELLEIVRANDVDYHALKQLLAKYEEASLHEMLNVLDECGNTALHIACKKEDLDLVQILLSFNADFNLTNNEGLTPIQCISYKTKNARKIVALFRQYENIRKDIELLQRETGINFDRALYLINEAMDSMNLSLMLSKSGVCFYGSTGVGKSTLVNFVRGMLYEPKTREMDTCREAIKSTILKDRASEGHSDLSETFYPKKYPMADKKYDCIDMPGLNDNRGKAYQVAEGVAITVLAKILPNIRALVFVCEEDSFKPKHTANLLEPLREIGRLIQDKPGLESNIILAITKCDLDKKHTLEIYKRRLTEIAHAYSKDADITRAVTAITAGDLNKRVIKTDVIDPDFRDQLLRIFDEINDVPTSEFNFAHHSGRVVQLIGIRDAVLKKRQELLIQAESSKQAMVQIEAEIAQFKSSEAHTQRTSDFINTLPEFTPTVLTSFEDLGPTLEKLRTAIDSMAHTDGLCGIIESFEKLEAEQTLRLEHLKDAKANHEESILNLEVFDQLYRGLYSVILRCLSDDLDDEQLKILRLILNNIDMGSTRSNSKCAGAFMHASSPKEAAEGPTII